MLSLIVSLIDLVLICFVYKIFKEVTDNQDELLQVLNDDIQRLRDDGK